MHVQFCLWQVILKADCKKTHVSHLAAAEYVAGSELDVEVPEDSHGLVPGLF